MTEEKERWTCPACSFEQQAKWVSKNQVQCYDCGTKFKVYGYEVTLLVDGWSAEEQ